MKGIRTATIDDVPQIMGLESISLKHPWAMDDIVALMDKPGENSGKVAILYEDNSVVASYVGASYVLDECEIGNVCTHPDYRRQGLAQAVLEQLINKCAELKIESVFLEVSSQNAGAIALYRKIGFEQYNMRRNYYGEGDDALLFVYKIQL